SMSEVVGFCGFHYLQDMDDISLGYVLRRSAQRKGYAIEASRTVLLYGFSALKIQRIVAVIDPRNSRSRKVVEKCGMTSWKETTWTGHDCQIYAATSTSEEDR